MSFLPVILSAFTPIAFVILLGVLAGRAGIMKPAASVVLSILVLDFCLPAELFNAMATTPLNGLPNWRFFAGMAAGLLGIFLLALVLALTVFRKPLNAAGLQALNASFPNIAFIGIPVVLAVIGKSAVVSTVIAIVISSLLLPPVALTLLAAGSPAEQGNKGLRLLAHSLWGALRQSVVWAPILGVLFALARLHMPAVAQSSFVLIGEATTGVALFALGLLLSGQKLRIGPAAICNAGLKNIAQPLVVWAIALALGLSGEPMRVMILCAALPTAPMTAMFAIKFNVSTEETDATILLSTVLSLLTVGVIIALTA
jgi:predicted permease